MRRNLHSPFDAQGNQGRLKLSLCAINPICKQQTTALQRLVPPPQCWSSDASVHAMCNHRLAEETEQLLRPVIPRNHIKPHMSVCMFLFTFNLSSQSTFFFPDFFFPLYVTEKKCHAFCLEALCQNTHSSSHLSHMNCVVTW